MFVRYRRGLRRRSPDVAATCRKRIGPTSPSRTMRVGRPRARVGRRLVPAGVRLLRQPGRLRRENDDGQIWIEPQGFCVMAGIGLDDGKAIRALDATRERSEHAARHRAAEPGLHGLPARARRGAVIPAGLQGERRASSATTTRGSSSPRPWWAAASRAWEYYKQIAPAYREHDLRGAPAGAVRLRADDRRQGRRARTARPRTRG